MTNRDIAAVFHEIGTLLEIRGENSFQSRAYLRAARTLESLPQDLHLLAAEDRLGELPGIGEALQDKIRTLLRHGSLPYLEDLKSSFPAGVFELLQIPGLGPKKVGLLLQELNVDSLDKLETACRNGSLADLAGFGEKTAAKLLTALEQVRRHQNQYHGCMALSRAEDLADTLRQHPAVVRAAFTGPLRRCLETVDAIHLLASSKKPGEVLADFSGLDEVDVVLSTDDSRICVRLKGGMPCELQIVRDSEFGSALHHFTGGPAHHARLVEWAVTRGSPFNTWVSGTTPAFPSEEELFAALDLDYIPPELREGLGEVEAAAAHQLPRLLEWTQLRGCFHNHTYASDGRNTLEEMAGAAAELGLEYLGIADHSKSSIQANGLSAERLLAQVASLRERNRTHDDIHLLAGVECDILKDGTLDFEDDVLSRLDYVVASVHSSFSLDETEMTRRIIRAMENPHVTMLGHATGRLLLEREGYAVNLEKVIDCAAGTGTWIELNANPWRLDMDWRYWRQARDKGVKCVINPDAHATAHLSYLKTGVHMARKGWLESRDVINCLPLRELLKILPAQRV